MGTAAIGVTPLLKLDLVREYITLRDFAGEVSGAVEAPRNAAQTPRKGMGIDGNR